MQFITPNDMFKNEQIPEINPQVLSDINSYQKSKQKQENIRFWIPVIISLASLAISIYAIKKQDIEPKQVILKDTVRIFVKSDSIKYQAPKNNPNKK